MQKVQRDDRRPKRKQGNHSQSQFQCLYNLNSSMCYRSSPNLDSISIVTILSFQYHHLDPIKQNMLQTSRRVEQSVVHQSAVHSSSHQESKMAP